MNWINVKDRMPEPEKQVLMCLYRGKVCLGWLTPSGTWWCKDNNSIEFMSGKDQAVVSWLPYPKPPYELPYYDKIGNTIEFKFDGKWHRAVVIKGQRTHDGAINARLEDGTEVWCGVGMWDVYTRPIDEGE